mmetsp:Transcript_5542/g.8261  ORF Transcript_5542/g.8261 Transcript_5542/m.8261 type:complete len:112 (-) Transcript_5542:36-371(-)
MSKVLVRLWQEGRNWEAWGELGQSVMKLANQQGEIFGYCGGQLACTTCRVYIPNRYKPLLSKPSEIEEDVLSELPNNPNFPEKDYFKRMSCQLTCKPQMHGISIFVPSTMI